MVVGEAYSGTSYPGGEIDLIYRYIVLGGFTYSTRVYYGDWDEVILLGLV